MTTTNEKTLEQLHEERIAARTAAVDRIFSRAIERLEEIALQQYKKKNDWTDEEHALVLPWAKLVRAKKLTYYGGTMSAMPHLPNRSFVAIRKKIRNYCCYGVMHNRMTR